MSLGHNCNALTLRYIFYLMLDICITRDSTRSFTNKPLFFFSVIPRCCYWAHTPSYALKRLAQNSYFVNLLRTYTLYLRRASHNRDEMR